MRGLVGQGVLVSTESYLESSAEVDGAYHWTLTRTWDRALPVLVCCGLNPSTADGEVDDHTIRRWVAFAKRDGFGGILVVNAYPWRATEQRDLKAAVRRWGDHHVLGGFGEIVFGNHWTRADDVIAKACRDATVLVCWGDPGGWGHGRLLDALHVIRAVATRVVCLGRTSCGQPRHPARLRSDTPMEDFS